MSTKRNDNMITKRDDNVSAKRNDTTKNTYMKLYSLLNDIQDEN